MAPALLSARATSATSLRLTFDVPIEATSHVSARIVASSTPAVPLAVGSWDLDGDAAVLTVTPEMTPGATYDLVIAGVTDAAGEPIGPPDDRASFLGFAAEPPAPRHFDLWSMLPRHVRRADTTGDLAAFIACLQDVSDLLLASVDRWPDILDLERAPEPFVDAMLADLGNPFDLALDLPARRRLVGSLVQMYQHKGTAAGIVDALRFFLGIEAHVVAYAGEALVLGESLLGVDWILGPSDRWARYAFDVEVDRELTGDERRHVRAVVDLLRPAHTHFVHLVEPGAPVPEEVWVLDEQRLGEGSVLA
jgi:phage tail-like protein